MNVGDKLLLLVALAIILLIIASGLLSISAGPVAIGIGNPKALARLTPKSFVEGYSTSVRAISGPKGNQNVVYLGGSNKGQGWFWPEGEYRGIAPLWNGTNYRDLARERCKGSTDPKCGQVSEQEYFNIMNGA